MPRQQTQLTAQDIFRAYDDERWLGWGYLSVRRHVHDPAVRAEADRRVIRLANERRWTYDQLFHWLNSGPGRHFADRVFSRDGTMADRVQSAVVAGLFAEVKP